MATDGGPDATENTSAQTPEAASELVGSSSRVSVPPPTPPSSRATLPSFDAVVEAPARFQTVIAVLLGLVLVGFPLYLWRRPRADAIAVARSGEDAGADFAVLSPPDPPPQAPPGPALTAPRLLACQGSAVRKARRGTCDRVPELERAFQKAIEDSASCVPAGTGGTIRYVLDLSFKKNSVRVYAPRSGRTVKSAKVAGACAVAVKTKLREASLDGMTHTHARYKIAISATYPGATR